MKTLLYRLSIGAGFIATTFLLGRLERGHFAFGAELIVSIVVGAWMIYQITLFCEEVVAMEKQWAKRGEHIRKLHTRIKNKDKFIFCLKETVAASNKQTLKLEHENVMLMERERFLEGKLEQIDAYLAEEDQKRSAAHQEMIAG